MACFTVPLAEAIIVSLAKKAAFKKNTDNVISESKKQKIMETKKKLGLLENLLYGGSFLLAIEHIYHGEVILFPPFLTALRTPEEIPVMLKEMATVGVGMALLTTIVWFAVCKLSDWLAKRKNPLYAIQRA
ncbi:hypothetical protein MSI_21080 [Treponema sp. JC4]|uniref:hypothetical protein n=1 Tax=Treponema sp. JC4 TaxID=1124982 RepID=UPI00025B0AEC|nr:hypothetical protein [Treponema sp. JC4]EID84413.1 hypothetical protein MSI_21080 [Treponema sp. JC4]